MSREKPQTEDPLKETSPARRIWAAREAKGINRSRFAKMMDVSYTTVDQWDLGKSSPRQANMRLASELLGYTIDELTYGYGGPDGAEADPPYAAWREFMLTPEYMAASDRDKEAMRVYRFPAGRVPTVMSYQMYLMALATTTEK